MPAPCAEQRLSRSGNPKYRQSNRPYLRSNTARLQRKQWHLWLCGLRLNSALLVQLILARLELAIELHSSDRLIQRFCQPDTQPECFLGFACLFSGELPFFASRRSERKLLAVRDRAKTYNSELTAETSRNRVTCFPVRKLAESVQT